MDPDCDVEPIAAFADKPNPFRARDINPLTGGGGSGALPFRPAPEVAYTSRSPDWVARGLWIPNPELQRMLKDGDLDDPALDHDQDDLAWNHGASQGFEKELKEIYVDVEMFDSRLWVRAGKQTIVWGKTELFSTTDQLNPRDLALATLPTLEESRIAQWAIRAVWSFYEVGPFEDVRFEVAAIFDSFEPNDIGRCGEPYSPLVACNKTFGLLNHGQNGIGIAGEIRPPNPWNSWKGIDVGGRLEWRYDRFSFALTDFYGYDDSFYVDRLFTYSRNVDPKSGRPRKSQSTGSCRHGSEDSCLTSENALLEHSVNQSAFAWVCAGTVGFSNLDTSACAQSVFGSQAVVSPAPVPVSTVFTMIGAGDNRAGTLGGSNFWYGLGGLTGLNGPVTPISGTAAAIRDNAPFAVSFLELPGGTTAPTLLVPLDMGINDGPPALSSQYPAGTAFVPGLAQFALFSGIDRFLTDQQEALLGCGPFYETDCDIDGVDFLNVEAGVFFQSFPNIQGTFQNGEIWDTTDGSVAQPGTVGFYGEYSHVLPGSRGPGDPGYAIGIDGTPAGAVHPITGQRWNSEMAIVSWNFLMALVALSQGEQGTTFTRDDANRKDVLDPEDSFSTERCSFARPSWCSNVTGLLSLTGLTRSSIKAGGNGRFGRRMFLWQGGGDVVLRYEKRNVLGFSMDFAEDVTKTNWGFELTWQEGLPASDSDAYDGNTEIDTFNMTISVDRPTFINFMNANRTFFFNSQWFFQYIEDYRQSHTRTGPWNFFFTFTASTGYFQDRLLTSMTFVYDVRSNSSAWLPQVTYRFTENFSATVGLGVFSGRWHEVNESINPAGGSNTNRVGKDRDKAFTEPGLSVVAERVEMIGPQLAEILAAAADRDESPEDAVRRRLDEMLAERAGQR